MQQLLTEVAQDDNIECVFGAQCQSVKPDSERGVQVEMRDSDGSVTTLSAQLVVGADGQNSKVREALSKDGLFTVWAQHAHSHFNLRQFETPSTGLRIKTLQIEPNFNIPVGDGTVLPLNGTTNYVLESVNKGPTNRVTLTVFPARDPSAIRPTAICTLPNHDVWKIDKGTDMKAWFQAAFPRFDFDGREGCLVAEEEWQRFAESKGSRFPICQYSPGAATHDGDAGVVLVGDALHTFPPDLGQGVNAAFADVVALDSCLRREPLLGGALDAYQADRGPETKALVKLARVGAPYQYQQASRILTIRRYLWSFNILLRITLNKLTLGLTPQPGVMQMMDSQLSFRTIMKSADRLTAALWAVTAAAVGLLVKGLC